MDDVAAVRPVVGFTESHKDCTAVDFLFGTTVMHEFALNAIKLL
jgi:hypothetical protein